jgi:2',3'-cyclic-nucleotide 2'-phosphodiesterase (5'-nucleotidase family)
VLFTGDTKGLVSPQPGIAGTLGGVARRLPAVERIRTDTPTLMLLDAGDAFASGFANSQSINRALVRAMNRMRYDARGLGPHDLAMGVVALRELVSISSFPFICSNLEFQTSTPPWIRPYVIVQREERKIAVISLLVPRPGLKVPGASFVPPAQALTKLMPQLAGQADAVVLMTQATRDEILPMLGAAPGVTVILGDPASTFQESPRYIPAVAKGMGLTLVELDTTNGVFRPGRSKPLLTSGPQSNNILEILNDIE